MAAIGLIGVLALVAVTLLVFAFGGWATVGAGERGVRITLGEVEQKTLEQGFYWKTPFVTQIIPFNVQTQRFDTTASAASKDLQSVTATIAVNAHVDPAMAWKVYDQLGLDYKSRVIDPAVEEAVKSATAGFTAEELVTKRNDVKENAKAKLKAQLAPFNIILDEFSIANFAFSPEFDKAVEQKVTAEQNALTAENELKVVQFQQQAEIEKSKALAEKTRLEAVALSNQASAENLIKKLQMEVFLELAKKWDGKSMPSNFVLGGSSTDMILKNLALPIK